MIPTRELGGLLVALGRAGIELAPHASDAARLRHRPATMPPDLLEGLRRHRRAIVGILAGEAMDDPGGEMAYTFTERLGVADELGLPTHPGSAAWLIATGEALGHAGGCARTTRKAG